MRKYDQYYTCKIVEVSDYLFLVKEVFFNSIFYDIGFFNRVRKSSLKYDLNHTIYRLLLCFYFKVSMIFVPKKWGINNNYQSEELLYDYLLLMKIIDGPIRKKYQFFTGYIVWKGIVKVKKRYS